MPHKTLSPEAAERMVNTSIQGSVTIYEIITWVFGKTRTREALNNPLDDPEFVTFVMHIDALINKAWVRRGIARAQGPYVGDLSIK